jgi:hypothetical protein
MRPSRSSPLVLALCVVHLAGCAGSAGSAGTPRPVVAPSPVSKAAPAQPAGAAPVAPAPAPGLDFRARRDEVSAAFHANDLGRAATLLAALRAQVAGQHPRLEIVVYYQAALAAYQGDLAGTAAIMSEHLAHGDVPADSDMRFAYHNALIMVRTGMADLTGALLECNLMTEAGQGPPFADDADGRNTVLLKEYWHEAYLLRMVAAASGVGWFHDGALAAARRAREQYRNLSRSIVGYDDSIAVLDAFFAVHDGDPAAALAAARRVDASKDDDIEDLYLVQMGLDFGGDAAAAAAVRARIAKLDEVSIAVPIMAMFIGRDLRAAAGGPPEWTPRHPRGARP